MSTISESPSPNNITLCPFCGVETPLVPGKRAGTRHCPRCWRTYPADHLDGIFVDDAADSDDERELDSDAILFEGQNYGHFRGEEW
jgi:hypothetical protein